MYKQGNEFMPTVNVEQIAEESEEKKPEEIELAEFYCNFCSRMVLEKFFLVQEKVSYDYFFVICSTWEEL
jgi:hypothetical protein